MKMQSEADRAEVWHSFCVVLFDFGGATSPILHKSH